LIGILDGVSEKREGNIYVTFLIQREAKVFFGPYCVADFGTLNAMTGESTEPAHGSGNVTG
jgi:hypothetical protein